MEVEKNEVLRVLIKAVLTELPDGSWKAHYGGHGWSVQADSRDEALRLLKESTLPRLNPYEPENSAFLDNPPEGWTVEKMTKEEYDARWAALMSQNDSTAPNTG